MMERLMGKNYQTYDRFNSLIEEERMYLGTVTVLRITRSKQVVYLEWERPPKPKRKLLWQAHTMRYSDYNWLLEQGFWVKSRSKYFDYQMVGAVKEMLIAIRRWDWKH